MVKVFINTHICVRSGYTKLFKCGTIAQLFEERLRINPKIRSHVMVEEIKREYNMIVTLEQCRRAKATLAPEEKLVMKPILLDFGIIRKRYFHRMLNQQWRLRQFQDQFLEANKDFTDCICVLKP